MRAPRIVKSLQRFSAAQVLAVLALPLAALAAAFGPRFYVGYFSDDANYVLAAQSLLQGRYVFLSIPGQPALSHFLPGYPLFLAPFVKLFAPHWDLLKLSTVLLNALSAWLIWKLFARWLDERPRALLVALFALNPLTLLSSSFIMSDPCFLFCVLASFYALTLALRRESFWTDGSAALLSAATALIRPIGLLMIFSVLLAFLWRRRWKSLVRSAVLAFFAVGVVALRNVHSTGTPTDYLMWFKSQIHSSSAAHLYFGGAADFLRMALPETLLGLRAHPMAGSSLGVLLTLLTAFVILLGFWRLARKYSGDGALMAAGFYCCAYLLVHSVWTAVTARYVLPILPFLLAFMLVGGSAVLSRFSQWRRLHGFFAGALLAVYLGVDAMFLRSIYFQAPPPGTRLPEATLSWIVHGTPANAVFLNDNAFIYLYTRRQGYDELRAKDREGFRAYLLEKGVGYIFERPETVFAIHGQGLFDQAVYRDEMNRWIRSWPDAFEPAYWNAQEGTLVYRVRPDPAFEKAYRLYRLATTDFSQARTADGLRNVQAALRLYPSFPRALYLDATARLDSGDPAGAERLFKEALRLRPTFALAMVGLARLYRKTGRPALVRPMLEDAAQALQFFPYEFDYLAPVIARERGLNSSSPAPAQR